jgi:hypothetical protein
LTLVSSCKDQREAISEEGTFMFKIKLLVLMKSLAKQLVLVAKGILKLGDSQGNTFAG